MKLLEIHAREALGMPPEWMLYRIDWSKADSHQIITFTGAIPTFGEDGKPNWFLKKRKVKHSVFNITDHRRWITEWRLRTGLCPRCVGDGQVFKRWTKITGTENQTCLNCAGTGKDPAMRRPPHD